MQGMVTGIPHPEPLAKEEAKVEKAAKELNSRSSVTPLIVTRAGATANTSSTILLPNLRALVILTEIPILVILNSVPLVCLAMV